MPRRISAPSRPPTGPPTRPPPSPPLAPAIPRAWTSAERRATGLPPEVTPTLLVVTRPDLAWPRAQPIPATAAACRQLRDRIGAECLAAYLLAHGDRPALKRLAASVQAEHPRTAPADKRSSHELVSYIARMTTGGRYVAAFDD